MPSTPKYHLTALSAVSTAILSIAVVTHFAAADEDHSAGKKPVPALGLDADLHGKQVFPADDLWNQDISQSPVDPNSANIIASIGLHRSLHPDFGTVYNDNPDGIPYIVVDAKQPMVPITFTAYGDESDKGPYPVPIDAQIEGGPKSDGDRHVLVIDRDHWMLYELDRAFPDGNGGWKADSGAIFNLLTGTQRPSHWTSADAAGLPIFPGLVRYDEVMLRKEVTHAIRFTVQKSRRAFVPPATHYAARSNDPNLPPMGMKVRLKADVDISGFPPECQVILTGLKKYGMINADNGGNWFISGAPDPRWNDDNLNTLKKIKGSDFEVVKMDGLVTN